ncbi:MAG TPA: hypothetical protein VF103_06925 [Polyangiaceae bacterium]
MTSPFLRKNRYTPDASGNARRRSSASGNERFEERLTVIGAASHAPSSGHV